MTDIRKTATDVEVNITQGGTPGKRTLGVRLKFKVGVDNYDIDALGIFTKNVVAVRDIVNGELMGNSDVRGAPADFEPVTIQMQVDPDPEE